MSRNTMTLKFKMHRFQTKDAIKLKSEIDIAHPMPDWNRNSSGTLVLD